jgi:hypothetical protein
MVIFQSYAYYAEILYYYLIFMAFAFFAVFHIFFYNNKRVYETMFYFPQGKFNQQCVQ